MVNGILPYAIKGALWYQGESNSPTANIYQHIMETLITDWREQWAQGNFPFIYVQLANIGKTYDSIPAKGGAEAIKREAQLKNLSLPETAMVVAIDNADPNDMNNVHPKNKQEIGRRLSLAAQASRAGRDRGAGSRGRLAADSSDTRDSAPPPGTDAHRASPHRSSAICRPAARGNAPAAH